MDKQLLGGLGKVALVDLSAGEYRVRLALRLVGEFTGGDLVRFSPGGASSVEGADESSSSYGRANWASGIASGALYAFRALRVPRQCVVVTELTGRLRSGDMDAVANGAAIAVAKLVGKDLPAVPTEGWAVQAEVMERQQSVAARANPQGPAVLSGPSGMVSPKRRVELRSMSTADLFLLVSEDRAGRELSGDELRLIHDIAAERMEIGDAQADTVLAEVSSFMS